MIKRMTRRMFLAGVATGMIAAAGGGCAERQSTIAARDPSSRDPAPTIIDPKRAAMSRQVTQHPLRFTDVSKTAGLDWTFQNGATGRHLFVESTGGGVALFDYNNDGLLDIFALQGGPVPGAKGAGTQFARRSVLYRNNGDGTFTDVTVAAGLGGDLGYGQGVSVADYNNDGWADLYVTSYGGNHLFRNNGDGTFTDVTDEAGVADRHSLGHPEELPWPLSSAWADYDNDGHLDLFVCHYCRWSLALNQACIDTYTNALSDCRPQVYQPSYSRLYHNNGDGTFTDVTHESGLAKLPGKAMGAVWIDYDDDGWIDLFITNDTMANYLLHNNRDGTFTNKALSAGVAYDEDGLAVSGMGIGVADYTNDGRPDLFIVNYQHEPKSIFYNTGGDVFTTAGMGSRMDSTSLAYNGFGLACFDYDLDGFQDIIVGNGHVLNARDAAVVGSSYAESQQLFHNQHDATFVEDLRSLGDLVLPRVTRGLAVGDFDNDGDIDVLMVSQTGPLQLFRNDGGNANHWITLRLEGARSNRDAVGAKVTIQTSVGPQTQWVLGGSSYCSYSDRRLTFGLSGESQIVSLDVRWPNGTRQSFGALPGNRFYWLREGAAPIEDPRHNSHNKT